MLMHPQFDPVAFSLGPLAVRWYGLAYLLAFVLFMVLGNWRIRRQPWHALSQKNIDDLLFLGVLGVVLGGRLGQVLFYEPGHYFSQPLEIFKVWKGGMSFHGGFLGVLVAVWWFCRSQQRRFLEVSDFVAPLVPLGLAAGRLANFVNAELWGRVASPTLPWGMVFPQADAHAADAAWVERHPQLLDLFVQAGGLPRHPSQLYELVLEGLVLFGLLWWFSRQQRPRGAVSALFLIGYGLARFMVEFFREPDHGIFGQALGISMGQWLSLPMIGAGVALGWYSYRAVAQGYRPRVWKSPHGRE